MIYEPDKGSSFYEAVKKLKQILFKENISYRQMLFNGIYITVSVNSNADDIAVIYDLKNRIRRLKAGHND